MAERKKSLRKKVGKLVGKGLSKLGTSGSLYSREKYMTNIVQKYTKAKKAGKKPGKTLTRRFKNIQKEKRSDYIRKGK